MEKSVVFYADILGFEEILKKDGENDSVLSAIKDAIAQSLKLGNSLSTIIEKSWFHQLMGNYRYRMFSDNLYLSFKYNEESKEMLKLSTMLVSLWARFYQFSLLSKRIFLRGAISYGSDYFDEHIIFSKALVKAYKIESNISIYPRIVIDKELVDNFLFEMPSLNNDPLFENSIVKDWSGIYFLNPYNAGQTFWKKNSGQTKEEWLSVVPKLVIYECNKQLEVLNSEIDYKVCQKLQWLKGFTEWFLDNKKNILGFAYVI